jgi:hypothetical protein
MWNFFCHFFHRGFWRQVRLKWWVKFLLPAKAMLEDVSGSQYRNFPDLLWKFRREILIVTFFSQSPVSISTLHIIMKTQLMIWVKKQSKMDMPLHSYQFIGILWNEWVGVIEEKQERKIGVGLKCFDVQ